MSKRVFEADLQSAYESVFNTSSGKLVLKHMMATGHVTTPCADVKGSRDQSLRNEGTQQFVLTILNLINKNVGRVQETTETIKEGIECPNQQQ